MSFVWVGVYRQHGVTCLIRKTAAGTVGETVFRCCCAKLNGNAGTGRDCGLIRLYTGFLNLLLWVLWCFYRNGNTAFSNCCGQSVRFHNLSYARIRVTGWESVVEQNKAVGAIQHQVALLYSSRA